MGSRKPCAGRLRFWHDRRDSAGEERETGGLTTRPVKEAVPLKAVTRVCPVAIRVALSEATPTSRLVPTPVPAESQAAGFL